MPTRASWGSSLAPELNAEHPHKQLSTQLRGNCMRTFRGGTRKGIVVLGALALLAVYPGVSTGNSGPNSVESALKISRERVEAINNATDVPKVTQNLIPGALEARNLAITQFKAAGSDAAPMSKPEYAVV